jgi:hypothetical protein
VKPLNFMLSHVVNSKDFIGQLDLDPGYYEITVNTNIVTGSKFIFMLELTEEFWYRLFPCILVFPSEKKTYVSLGETLESGTTSISNAIKNAITLVKTLDK